jgi:hypothetical protein
MQLYESWNLENRRHIIVLATSLNHYKNLDIDKKLNKRVTSHTFPLTSDLAKYFLSFDTYAT